MAVNDLGQKCSAGTYSSLQTPLGAPPKGMEWKQNPETHEWSIVAVATDKTTPPLVAGKTASSSSDDGMIEHVRTADDTFQGICVRYGITGRQLRQANGGFSGSQLILAPPVLRIPPSSTVSATTAPAKMTEQQAKQAQVREIRRAVPALSFKEARCYLDLNDGNVDDAISNAKEDAEFEVSQQQE